MTKVNIPPEPWERQQGETPKAYGAFQVYRDLGAERSLQKAAAKLGKSRGLLEDWSSKNYWVKRVAAWDAEQDRIARQAQIDEIKKMRKRHADLAYAMLIKAANALKRMPEDEIKAMDIGRFVEVGSKLERLSRGDVGDVIEERMGEDSPPIVTFYMPDNHRQDKEGEEDD